MRRTWIATLLLGIPSTGLAKDLSGRVAVGVDQTIARTPALSVRYGVPLGSPVRQLQLEGDLSLDVTQGADLTEFFLGGRAMYGVVAEDNLNLYLTAGIGILNAPEGFNFRLQPGCSLDFFVFGLENLGLTTSFGLDIDLGTSDSMPTGFATGGKVLGGVHYWF